MIVLLISISSAFGLYPATWIGDALSVIGNLTLKQVTLPGTHDSGAYYLGNAPIPGEDFSETEQIFLVAEELDLPVEVVTRNWALTQTQNFYDQMKGGIRYFDLRSGWYNPANQWFTFHFVIGNPVEYLLRNISNYLNDYPTEIVIVEMSHFDGYPNQSDVDSLKVLVLDILGKYLYPVDLSFNFTINDMVRSGKRALVTMEQDYDNITLWPPDTIYNTYADSPDLKTMLSFNIATAQQFMNSTWPGQLFKVSWTLTADSQTILDSVLPWKPHTLIQLADIANPALPSFWSTIKKNNWKPGNILIIDDYTKSQIIEVIWSINSISSNLFS
jgi:hypothetical protein